MIDSTVTKKILEKVAKIKDQLFVIKLSEIIISNKNLLTNFAYNISLLSDNGIRLIIVFEYENIVNTRLQEIAGSKEVDYSCFGQERLSELAEMIISGSINSYIVSQLCSYSVQTVGLSGKDNNTLIAKKPSATARSYIGEAILVNPELLPAIVPNNALRPIAVLLLPVVEYNASNPIAVL